MQNRVLITYATRAGSTAEVAGGIGEILSGGDAQVDVLPVSDLPDISRYQAVVMGSPIHSGQWLPEAAMFVDRHSTTLRQMPTACFTLALRLRDNSEDTRQSVLTILNPLRLMLNPVSIGLFAGVMDYGKLSAIMRLQAQTKGLPEGDFRDWNAIRTWAGELNARLLKNR